MRFEDAIAELDRRQPEHMPGPSLARIRRLVDLLDHPELTYPTIHVTGTNGKSTAARAAAAVSCAHDLTAGLYISPHLVELTERWSVCGVDMTRDEFAEEWAHLAPFLELVDAAGDGEVTYFEAVTALAFLWFADKPVGLGVFEVGMGGSWDATNLIMSDVAVVTPVGMDHVAELGPTLADIAGEKAGIIKDGRTVVLRDQAPEAGEVLRARARDVGAAILEEGRDWEVEERLLAVGGQSFRLRTPRATYEDLFIPVFGDYAVANAAAAVAAFEALTEHGLHDDALREGLAEVRTPGRLEVVGRNPLVVLDGAHNPDGAQALAGALPATFCWQRLHVVLATSANKDIEGIVGPLAAIADEVYVTRNDSVRSAEPEVVAAAATAAGAGEVHVLPGVREALEAAMAAAASGDAVLVTGSLFTVGDAERALAGR